MAETTLTQKVWAAALRLLRLIIGQLPFIITLLQGQTDPKLVAFGVFLNSAMKFVRDVFPKLSWIPL